MNISYGRLNGDKYYVTRRGDDGNTSERCPRCQIYNRQTRLTIDAAGYKYCMACAWERCWSEDGLPITV